MPRLVLAIISSTIEEAALVIIVLWGLPELGIHIPVPGLVAIMVVWLAISVIIYRIGSHALQKKIMAGLPHMTGTRGKVVSPLSPEGLVRIRGELWAAKSNGGEIQSGEKITVVEQENLKLVVRKSDSIPEADDA